MILNKKSQNFLIIYNKYFYLNRCVVSLTNAEKENFSSNQDPEWNNALPMTSIPGPSKFRLIKEFLPFGKYYKKPRSDFKILLHKEYGDLIRIPAFAGNPDVLLLYEEKYFEKIYRNEGKWPRRFAFPSIKHYRTVKDPETFAVGDLLTFQGEVWGKFRSIVNPVMMQPRTIKIYIPKIEKISRLFIDRIRKIRDPESKEVPGTFDTEIHKWAIESVCVVALDNNMGLLEDDINKNPDAFKLTNALEIIFQTHSGTDIFTVSPLFFKYIETPKFKKLMKAHETITKIAKKYIGKAIENYQLNEITSDKKYDLDKSIVERLVKINKDVAIVLVVEMFFTGIDTTTSALTGCLLSLAKNPDKQEKLRSELRKILPNKNTIITEQKLKNLPYLRAVIKESLRMYPVITETARKAGDNFVVKNYQIPKGIDILILNSRFYKNENHFSQPDQFIPERWIRNGDTLTKNSECPIAGKSSNPFIYLPFGYGARMCIGKRIVEMELEIILANIIRNFNVEFNYAENDVFTMFLINTPTKELKFKFVDIQD